MSIYPQNRLPRPKNPLLQLTNADVRSDLRPMLRNLLGKHVLAVGGQGSTVPRTREELVAANQLGTRIPIADRALVFELDNNKLRKTGLTGFYEENADAAIEHAMIGYPNKAAIQADLPNLRSLQGDPSNYKDTGRGMPLAATGIVLPYENNPGRLGINETQDVFGARYFYNMMTNLERRRKEGSLRPGQYDMIVKRYLEIAQRLDDRNQLIYDVPERTMNTIRSALTNLLDKGQVEDAGFVRPGGFYLSNDTHIPFTPGDFVKPGAGRPISTTDNTLTGAELYRLRKAEERRRYRER